MVRFPRRGLHRRAAAVLAALALSAACASTTSRPPSDTADAILLLPVEQVRTAAVQVLLDQGYELQLSDDTDRVISTRYREEIEGPWDWLLHARFGVNRSRVDIALIPEGDHATLVSIYVSAYGKDSLFAGWRPYETPLPQSAGNQLRLLKNALGLL